MHKADRLAQLQPLDQLQGGIEGDARSAKVFDVAGYNCINALFYGTRYLQVVFKIAARHGHCQLQRLATNRADFKQAKAGLDILERHFSRPVAI